MLGSQSPNPSPIVPGVLAHLGLVPSRLARARPGGAGSHDCLEPRPPLLTAIRSPPDASSRLAAVRAHSFMNHPDRVMTGSRDPSSFRLRGDRTTERNNFEKTGRVLAMHPSPDRGRAHLDPPRAPQRHRNGSQDRLGDLRNRSAHPVCLSLHGQRLPVDTILRVRPGWRASRGSRVCLGCR